ncbi:MAG: AAA family ATPase [Prolixibacteraceae bacterium]|jgi:DNA polymerase-3 subunit gamma/tau
MGLYLKYRPNALTEIEGNREIVITLRGMFKKNEIPHSMLFHGPTGCGKTTLARIVAKELGCTENNLIEIDTAQFRGIDTVRDLRKNIQYTPLGGGIRVYIIDEVHKMTGDAQNAFLKILEDTPLHIYFILCTTDPQSLLPTIKGRCSQFQVQLLSDDDMKSLLTKIAELENDSIEDEIIEQITQDSQGHPRNALQILEQVLSTPKKRRLTIAQQAAIEQSESIALCRALMKKQGWSEVKKILQGLKGQDAEGIRRVVIGYASSVLLNTDNAVAGLILEAFQEPTYNMGFPGIVLACYTVIKS